MSDRSTTRGRWSSYERLVRTLIRELTQQLESCRLSKKNKIAGASGFRHQIDVSLKTGRTLLLLECKYWRRRVDVGPVLVIASRLADVRAANRGLKVKAALVSTKKPTVGAQRLARYFDVQLDVVETATVPGPGRPCDRRQARRILTAVHPRGPKGK